MTSSFTDLSGFLAMGGYGVYVWPAYGIVALVLVGQVLQVKRLGVLLLAKSRGVANLDET